MIDFNVPPYIGTEMEYVRQSAEDNHKICGDGPFTKRCQSWLEERFCADKVLLTTSGTTALEMAAMLCDLEPGDEVILPSFTFSSTATAFVLMGAKLVFVDILPDTKNIDPVAIEAAITEKTRVIAPVHYAGVACDMDEIMAIAKAHDLLVVEDAAQGVMSTYKGKALGTIGDFGCYSFHETKNYSMGQVDKYTWVDKGSSYLPSDMNAAYLWGQLEAAQTIYDDRMATWHAYNDAFADLAAEGLVELPVVPDDRVQNAHMYYLLLPTLEDRTSFISFLKESERASGSSSALLRNER